MKTRLFARCDATRATSSLVEVRPDGIIYLNPRQVMRIRMALKCVTPRQVDELQFNTAEGQWILQNASPSGALWLMRK